MKRKHSVGGWLALILFVVIPLGIPIVIGARRTIIACSIAARFQPTQGEILVSRAELRVSESHDSSGGVQTHAAWYPDVQFRYRAQGREYVSGVYAHPSGVSIALRASEQGVKTLVEGFKPGQTYPAWFDPETPEIAYLHLDSPWGGVWTITKTLIIGALVYGAIVAGAIVLRRQR